MFFFAHDKSLGKTSPSGASGANSMSFSEWLKQVGTKWQKIWKDEGTFEADPDPSRPKKFFTFPYPYVNGSVHVGHGYSQLKVEAVSVAWH